MARKKAKQPQTETAIEAYIRKINEAIADKSCHLPSDMSPDVHKSDMSDMETMCLINRLVAIPKQGTYLEIGAGEGVTFFAAIWGHSDVDGLAIDYYNHKEVYGKENMWNCTKETFEARRLQYHRSKADGKATLIIGDAFSVETVEKCAQHFGEQKVGLLFSDSDKRTEKVEQIFKLYSPLLADIAIMVVDDYECKHSLERWAPAHIGERNVRKGVANGLIALETHKVVKSWELPARGNGGYHAGLFIALLKRNDAD